MNRTERLNQDAIALLQEAYNKCRSGHHHNIVSNYWLNRVKALLDENKRAKAN